MGTANARWAELALRMIRGGSIRRDEIAALTVGEYALLEPLIERQLRSTDRYPLAVQR